MRLNSSHIALISALFGVLMLAGCQTIQFERPHVLSESDWPTDDGQETRSRYHDVSTGLPMQLAWEYGANAGFGPASPLILQDRVLIGNRKGELHSVELETGRGRGFKQLVDVIEGSPLIHEGLALVPAAWGRDVLVAFDLSQGAIRWKKRRIPFSTSLIAHGSEVVAVDVEGTLRAFEVEDGEELWTMSLGGTMAFKASPVRLSETDILLVESSGTAFRVNLDEQTVVWERDLGAPVYSTPAVDGNQFVVTTTRGDVALVDASTGQEVWRHNIGEHMRVGSPALGPEWIVFGATDGQVRSLSRIHGQENWSVQFDDVVTAPPLLTDSAVFVGTLGEELYALDITDGRILWETEVRGRIKSAMAWADEGLLVLTEPKWLMYYKPVSSEENDE